MSKSIGSSNASCPFMINNKLQNYPGRMSKGAIMWTMMVDRRKNGNLDQIMYGKDFDGGKDGDDDDGNDCGEEATAKKLKRISKGEEPREISEERSSLYHRIMT
jgi:hypothetical protein